MVTNEGLPIRDSLFELYIWFCQEREVWIKKVVVEDLKILGEYMYSLKEERHYKEIRRENK